ncbi:MAG: hypothetical protein QXU40_01345 [Candidatus Pacearchaeota archaeon]
MLTLQYSEEEVKKQLRQNVSELANTLSNYDLFSEEERIEHTNSKYISGIVGIASHLDVLGKYTGLKDVRVLERLFRVSPKLDNFDPRYISEYSSKWNEKPDVQAKINQKIIDLENILKIEDNPQSRFILLNAIKYLAGKDVDSFVLRKVKSNAKKLKEIANELKKDFDVIDIPYNANIEGDGYFDEKSNEFRIRLPRKEFEIYFLSELRKNIAKSFKGFVRGEGIDIYISPGYNKDEIVKIVNNIKRYIRSYNIKVSDESVELFLKKYCGNSPFEGLLFNQLFNIAKRTKLDFNADKDIYWLFFEQKGLYARNFNANGNGDWRFGWAGNINVQGDLNANGNGDARFYGAWDIKVKRDFNANGEGDDRFYEAENIVVKRDFNANGRGDKRFFRARDIVVKRDFNANGDGYDRFYEAENINVQGNLNVNGNGDRRFWGVQNIEVQGDLNANGDGDLWFYEANYIKVGRNLNADGYGGMKFYGAHNFIIANEYFKSFTKK